MVKGFSLFTLYVFLTGRDVLNLTMVFHGHYQRLRFMSQRQSDDEGLTRATSALKLTKVAQLRYQLG